MSNGKCSQGKAGGCRGVSEAAFTCVNEGPRHCERSMDPHLDKVWSFGSPVMISTNTHQRCGDEKKVGDFVLNS